MHPNPSALQLSDNPPWPLVYLPWPYFAFTKPSLSPYLLVSPLSAHCHHTRIFTLSLSPHAFTLLHCYIGTLFSLHPLPFHLTVILTCHSSPIPLLRSCNDQLQVYFYAFALERRMLSSQHLLRTFNTIHAPMFATHLFQLVLFIISFSVRTFLFVFFQCVL